MLEIFDLTNNIIQMICLAAATVWAASLAIKQREKLLFQFMAAAMACFLLGDIFLVLYLWIAGDNPIVFSAADLSYIGMYFFLISINLELVHQWTSEQRVAARKYRRAALIAPLIIVLFSLAYIAIYVDILLPSVIYCIPLCFLGYYALWLFLCSTGRGERKQPLHTYHGAVLLFLAVELVMFLVSSFGWYAPGIALDFILTIVTVLLVPALKKGVEA